jgi:opacity protein-like surface antigen
MLKLLLALLISAAAAFPAGLFSIGIKGGVPFTDAFNAATNANLTYVTHSNDWTLGPEFDLNLPFGIGVEADVLYRGLKYQSSQNLVDQLVTSTTTARAWDFPLLLKWKAATGPFRPYVVAGPTFRGLTSINQVTSFFSANSGSTTTSQSSNPTALKSQFITGMTLGGGIQLLGHVSPEIRYTRWGWNSFREPSGLLSSNQNQFEVLVGITF